MSLATCATLFFCLALAADGRAFAYVKTGDEVENPRLRTMDGTERRLLGEGRASVFLFFSPGQQYSKLALEAFAKLEREFEDRPVSWIAIVSDRHPAADVRALLEETGVRSAVLQDSGDAIYGKLGAATTPVSGIVDAQHRLVVSLQFQKVNYEATFRAWLRRALGEISDEELAKLLEPPPLVKEDGEKKTAHRHLKMGERLLKLGDFDGAAEAARKSLAVDPEVAAAHALLGAALAGGGKCGEALPVLEKALALDPANAAAKDGKARCGTE